MLKRIAIYLRHPQVDCWNFHNSDALHLRQLLPQTELAVCRNEDEFLPALHCSDACMVWRFEQSWFESAPALRILSTPAAGKDYFRVTPPESVRMMNGQFHGDIIAETVLGMLYSVHRGILHAVTQYADLPWPRRELSPQMRTLRGTHAVLLGFGNIGQRIGRLLAAVGVRVTGVCRHPERVRHPSWFSTGDCIRPVTHLDDILPTADHLILALPSTRETDNILDGRRLNLLQKHAVLINVGRGNAIEEMALYGALSGNRFAGAFLDVFPQEPLTRQALFFQCPRLWRLPHASAIAPDYMKRYLDDFVRQLRLNLPVPYSPPSEDTPPVKPAYF